MTIEVGAPSRSFRGVPFSCKRCDQPRPARHHYCDPCKKIVADEKALAAKLKRQTPCRRCGGPKGTVLQGAKYCNSCRDAMVPLWQVAERERGQRKAEKARRKAGIPQRRKPEIFDDGTRTCTACGQRKKNEHFSAKRRGDRSILASYCKPCSSGQQHELRLVRTYGITIQQYEIVLESQGGRCAICLRKPRRQRLAVDHNHKTGEIRGLLCSMCNHRVLGGAMERIEILRRAADYLENPPARGMW